MPSRPFYERALGSGRVLLWPRLGAGDRLEFAACARWEELRPGRYGVPSPPTEAAPEALGAGDLVLVPGLAFDGAGRRLGRGGGHYDRALAAAEEGTVAIGVGYEFQRVDAVPVEPHDVALDAVVTERGLFRSAVR
jgi:5-formyltetrahydrofolate cyclo-ligase